MEKSKNILVTGGAGYIGSVTTKLLLDNRHQVVVIDNLSSGKIRAIPQGAIFVKGDINNKQLLQKLFRKYSFDCVIHFAAYIRVEESVQNPKKYFYNNVLAGINLLKTMIDCSNCRKIIYSSSAAVYGMPDKVPIVETAPLKPINPYGQTKMIFEMILQEYAKAGLIDCVILRYFNAAGAYITPERKWGENHEPETHIIPLILKSVRSQQIFTIYGDDYKTEDGTCVRDYIHLYDIAQAHISAMEKGFKEINIYNVGRGKGYSNKQVFDTARAVTQCKINYKFGPKRAGDAPMLIAFADKIKKELKFKPKKSELKTIIQDAWEYCSATINK